MTNKVLVIGEAKENRLRNVTFEAIAAAKVLDENAEVVGVLCGDTDLEACATEMVQYGADRVKVIYNEILKTYTSGAYAQALLPVIKDEAPTAILMGHTAIGKELTPKLASRLNVGLVSDVTELEKVGDQVVFTRPIYSGKAFERKVVIEGTAFATIRPNNIAPLERDEARSGEVSTINADINDLSVIVKEIINKTATGGDLSEARVVVAGGRGVKSKEGFDPLYELADVLGGVVGASRGACDADYCDYSLQIGQTGKVVTPDLYIACGISGAIQHLAGMSNSKVIVAINKDPEASIFNIADYGIVGDLFEIIPKLTEAFKELKVHS
ncbi:electron transfer flavoprotein subunit alpha/FixB family protein [Radiobacillus sp. PE A8.2]|uniref:electron transfer flavoprotein subunit alpha/FixB family protein n=1 Tax=Radiobacillus sp. PE A8.2 TaxID=3380349 RepID=UPI00388F65A4